MRVLALVHESLIPPSKVSSHKQWYGAPWKTEFDVVSTLKQSEHQVQVVGIGEDLKPIAEAAQAFRPQVVFNLLEEFAGEAIFDQHVVSLLEMLQLKYTGCNPRGLTLARDKALAKMILRHWNILTPEFWVFSRCQKWSIPRTLRYPVFVKSLTEDASLGITRKSIVTRPQDLKARVEYFFEELNSDVLVEEYIEGRELYVGVLGNNKPQAMTPWELYFAKASADTPIVATRKVKWDLTYRRKLGVKTAPASLSGREVETLQAQALAAYTALKFNGYGRMDFRRDRQGQNFFIEANPNPDIGNGDDFAASAAHSGWTYARLLEKILKLGRDWSSV